MIKLIILDWDDVIVLGAKEAYFTCYHHALTSVGVHLPREEERKRILAKWSKPAREELRELLKEHPDLVEQAYAVYQKQKSEIFLKTLHIHSGMIDVLLNLAKRYVLAVATGNTTEIVRDTIIPHFRIPPVFAHILSSYDIHDVNKTKPHPYMLEKIMKTQTVRPDETIYVGDATTDVQMARSAGVTPIVVLTGHLSKKEAHHLGVTWIISDITLLPTVLTKIETVS